MDGGAQGGSSANGEPTRDPRFRLRLLTATRQDPARAAAARCGVARTRDRASQAHAGFWPNLGRRHKCAKMQQWGFRSAHCCSLR